MARFIVILATLAISATCLTAGSPVSNEQPRSKIIIKNPNGEAIDIYENRYLTDEGDLLPYEPVANRRLQYESSQMRNEDNSIKPALSLEREGADRNRARKLQVPAVVAASTADETDSPNADRFGSIAFNSREVRLVGPNQREVDMKDDVATKMVVVLENLQKEATEVWDQVNDKLDQGLKDIKRSEVWSQLNDKLDKGWTDLKSMVEGVVSPASKRQP